ncbi:MAG: DUF4838 domain-containing protein [Candidatus Glassbacteria bacterium]|nr:DUF4838 domain-containing protein [Candidatus Glassbacteria bacterium]
MVRPVESPASKILLFILLSFCAACSREEMLISDNGNARLAIVTDFGDYADNAAAAGSEDLVDWNSRDERAATVCTEAFAAMELRTFLCRIAGLDQSDSTVIPILEPGDKVMEVDNVIVVGQTAGRNIYRELDREIESASGDAFIIRSGRLDGKNTIVIRGKTRSGTLYGVYHLLNLLGCRWYAPGPDGEIIPRRDRLVLGNLDITRQPAAEIRGFWVSNGKVEAEVNDMTWEGRLTDRGDDAFFTWMARNRLNFFWNREEEWRSMKKLGIGLTAGEHVTYYELLRADKPYPYDHSLFHDDGSLPEDPYPVGDEYRGDLDNDGTLSYAEAHPEWYGITREGERFFPVRPFGTNYCTSSESGFAELMKNIIVYLRNGDGHNADTFSFWPLDGGEWCSCARCSAEDKNDTDILLELVYKIRQGLKQAYHTGELDRDIPVHSLIYVQTKTLPSRELPADFDYDNIVLTYFPIGRCYAHNFNDTLCTEVNCKYLQVLLDWSSESCLYRGKLLLGEYYNISGFRDLPLVFKTTMANDIPFYLNSGIAGLHYMHPSIAEMGVRRLINYQLAQTLWDPELDTDQLLDDYFNSLYGPAAPAMKEFYDLLETAVANVKAWRYYLRPRINAVASGRADSIFPIPVMKEHLHYQACSSETDDALDWIPMIEKIHQCRSALDRILAADLPPALRRRIEEDEYGFQHLEASTDLFDSLIILITQQGSAGAEYDRALLRARKAAEFLGSYRIKSPALGVANAYEATDLVEACRILLAGYDK